jgi:hypothetical protein
LDGRPDDSSPHDLDVDVDRATEIVEFLLVTAPATG